MINSSFSCYMLMICRLCQDVDMIQKLKGEFSKTFDMKDLGNEKHILGMEILQDRKEGLWLSHERYIERILEMVNMKKKNRT